MIGSQLLRFKKDQIYNCLDFETEGLNLHFSRPWQLSYTVFRLNEILDQKTYYIWYKDLKVSAKAAQITGFDYNKYKSAAISPKEIFDEISPIIDDPEVITSAHNLFHYDAHIYNNFRRSLGLGESNDYLSRAIDTLALSIAYKNGIKFSGDFYSWQYKMLSNRTKGTSLSVIAKDFGIQIDESKLHDAGADTEILVEILKKLIWSIEI